MGGVYGSLQRAWATKLVIELTLYFYTKLQLIVIFHKIYYDF